MRETGGGRSQEFFHRVAGSHGMTPAEGALPQIRAATDPDARSGQFYVPLWVQSGPPVRKPILRRLGAGRAIKRLWEVSERETGVRLERQRRRGLSRWRSRRSTGPRRCARRCGRSSPQHGFHGASMSAVAAEAGVATGTAYTHYASKDELVLATYLETKAELAEAATANLSASASPQELFREMWLGIYRHLAANRDHALFLLQVDCSPYKEPAHEAAMARDGDPLVEAAAAPEIAELLLPLPLEVLYELGLGAGRAPGGGRRRS